MDFITLAMAKAYTDSKLVKTDICKEITNVDTAVVVCTPTCRTNKTTANSAGLTLLDYANIEKEIAESNGCEVVDLNAHTNTNEYIATLGDGLHPGEVGQKIIADIIFENY